MSKGKLWKQINGIRPQISSANPAVMYNIITDILFKPSFIKKIELAEITFRKAYYVTSSVRRTRVWTKLSSSLYSCRTNINGHIYLKISQTADTILTNLLCKFQIKKIYIQITSEYKKK
jgi:hypothetical protein